MAKNYNVTVREKDGTYTASCGNKRASATDGAESAARKCAEKMGKVIAICVAQEGTPTIYRAKIEKEEIINLGRGNK